MRDWERGRGPQPTSGSGERRNFPLQRGPGWLGPGRSFDRKRFLPVSGEFLAAETFLMATFKKNSFST